MKKYGEFEPVPCPQGAARITKPEILHGSTGNPGLRRRTVLAWFVAVAAGGETLDNAESNKWSELAAAHIGHRGINLTPLGLANRFGAIPYAFPATT
ncbi:hypothetical protein MMC14_004682 [Varicellaria rhodocarpa]|nr:hypothetical protein [Varicellaria rhodocarpa]